MKRAVFLDRDGVINELVMNPGTGEYEPPHSPEDLSVFPYVIDSLHILLNAGFVLFLISNQPDFAKGKTTMENIRAVQTRLNEIFEDSGIHFQEYCYCYHHPDGIEPEYSISCECRKPKPYFIIRSAKKYHLDLHRSWMIGDRDSDIVCGKAAGTRTIAIEYKYSIPHRGKSCPDFIAANLNESVDIIIEQII
jgi:D-glycero-D-manno-heptose 1,7-bisphosphate phosphatase